MNYRAMKDFLGADNTVLIHKGAIINDEDLMKHPWLRRSIRSGTIVEVAPPVISEPILWHSPILDEDPFDP